MLKIMFVTVQTSFLNDVFSCTYDVLDLDINRFSCNANFEDVLGRGASRNPWRIRKTSSNEGGQ